MPIASGICVSILSVGMLHGGAIVALPFHGSHGVLVLWALGALFAECVFVVHPTGHRSPVAPCTAVTVGNV